MTNDQMKHQVLKELRQLAGAMGDKLVVLEALDGDSTASGCRDLNDQLTTLTKSLAQLVATLDRAQRVVPVEDF